jgi:HEAT repeat protein
MLLSRIRFGSVCLLTMLLTVSTRTYADDRNASPDKERELLAVLESDSPGAEKAITCKLLAIHGSAAAVPQLARLLENEQLSSWARIALEAIPGPEAKAALRHATNSLTGRLLVGTINSIGVGRDAEAVDLLVTRLQDPDAEVASAAAVALGRIGNPAAAKALRPLLATSSAETRSAIAEGAVLCAERFFLADDHDAAVALYDDVRKADVPRQRILEATRGAILARKTDAGIALLIEQLNSKELALFQIGLSTAREFPGSQIDKALAAELAKAAPERAALVIHAMADRKETVVLPAVVKAASQGPKPVRLAAIGALGRVGNDTCLAPLLQAGVESDADLASAAKDALSDLPGASVDKEIVSRLAKAEGKSYPLLIELVGKRRISAIPELQKALDNSDKNVRSAALTALGATVPPKNLSILITQFVSPKHAEDEAVAKQALMAACIRMPDREVCADDLSKALAKSEVSSQTALLQILGAVGGTKALQTIGASAKSSEPELQDAASKLLGEWMTIDAAPVLLDLTKTAPDEKYKARAIRGYIRIARQFVMPEPERLAMCEKALQACRNASEQKLLFDILKRYPTIDTLKMALKMIQDVPELKDDGTQAVMAIAQKLSTKGDEVTELLTKGGLGKVKLEIVKAEYGAGPTQKDVTETLQKQASDFQLVSLPQAGYNEAFGGDPAPNTVKQLKVQYRINGKDGQATFAENALIVLPMPK